MKKTLVLLVLLLLVYSAFGLAQILYKDTFTICYDEPAVMPNLLSGESIVYRIWLWDAAQGSAPIATTVGWIFYAETPILEQYVVTPIDPRCEYAVGIELVHIRADLIETVSDFAVTTSLADIDPGGFPGVPFVYAPAGQLELGKVRNLRDSGI